MSVEGGRGAIAGPRHPCRSRLRRVVRKLVPFGETAPRRGGALGLHRDAPFDHAAGVTGRSDDLAVNVIVACRHLAQVEDHASRAALAVEPLFAVPAELARDGAYLQQAIVRMRCDVNLNQHGPLLPSLRSSARITVSRRPSAACTVA